MVMVNTHEAKTQLSALLTRIEKKHETVIICRNGHPIAEISSFRSKKDPLLQSQCLKKVVFIENPLKPISMKDWPKKFR